MPLTQLHKSLDISDGHLDISDGHLDLSDEHLDVSDEHLDINTLIIYMLTVLDIRHLMALT